ncbi:baseplate J/gp47 family protein [Selenomonas sp. AE3005]|uniref:baseplate assembly protein n=1 Tax=Selenomonas sp. AE3005 TaxID=1485543 RepID=UPI0025FECEC9|nr:baseplate J/gp47 family protein [Selenomonas sp. AE3005]
MNLSNLPAIEFVDADTETAKAEIIAKYEEISGRSLAAADPIRLFLESVAAENAQLRAAINKAGKMNLLAYAVGDYLDHLGVLVDTDRLAASRAQTTIEFTLSAALQIAVTIPAGTRITDMSQTAIFATSETLTIAAGQITGTVTAYCTEAGTAGNGYIAGQLQTLIDPVPYVESAFNKTISVGGADIEDDDDYRERIHLAPESFSVAGPKGAYEFWAKSASSLVEDVAVFGPEDGLEPGCVEVYPLLEGGQIPTQEILDAVLEVINDDKIRPLTDRVSVLPPSTVSYRIELTYYIDRSNVETATAVQEAVDNAITKYKSWQKAKLGRDIDPSKLVEMMVQAGAVKVTIASPVITSVANNALAVADDAASNIIYGGISDD